MTSNSTRDPVVQANEVQIVEARPDEDPEYWLVSNAGDEFPLWLNQLHDLLDVLDYLHEEEHQH